MQGGTRGSKESQRSQHQQSAHSSLDRLSQYSALFDGKLDQRQLLIIIQLVLSLHNSAMHITKFFSFAASTCPVYLFL